MSHRYSVASHPQVQFTEAGTAFLKEPGVVLLSQPSFFPESIRGFIDGFGDVFDADDYINDCYEGGVRPADPGIAYKHSDGELLAKFAGQMCYFSLGTARTRNDDAEKYFDNIKSSGHGSVLEHANYSFLFYGIGRDFTHELVRHRAGMAYSQVSQRYTNGKTLRFVERPEFQKNLDLHTAFVSRIDTFAKQYDWCAEVLRAVIPTEGMSKTDARKAVNQAARSLLPNETEAPIVATGNVRAWRNVIDQRANKHADRPIRTTIFRAGLMLQQVAPLFFGDYVPDHESETLTSKYRKI